MGTALSGTSSEGPFSRRGGTLDPIKFDGNVASVRHFTPLNLMGTRHLGWTGSTQCKRKLLTQKSAVAGEREALLVERKIALTRALYDQIRPQFLQNYFSNFVTFDPTQYRPVKT